MLLWERGGAGAQGEGFSQENRANAPCAADAAKGFPTRYIRALHQGSALLSFDYNNAILCPF